MTTEIIPARMRGSILNRTPAEIAAHLVWLDPGLDVRIEGETVEVAQYAQPEASAKFIGKQSRTMSGHIWAFRSYEIEDWGNGPEWEPSTSGLNGGGDSLMAFRFVPAHARLGAHGHLAMRAWIGAGQPEDLPMADFIVQGRAMIADEQDQLRLVRDLKSVNWSRLELSTVRSVHALVHPEA